jgi:uncharacterized protein YfaS (alpha-2-macroglobulin family)
MKFLLATGLLFFYFFSIGQRTYTKEWKRVDSLIEKTGLIKTALKEVNGIYSSAKRENNDVQVIRALVYRMQLNDQLSDSGRYENITLLEKEILTAKEPAKSILHSIAGSRYWSYLQMNRWQFYQRSNTKGYDSKDISTWSLEQLYNRITSHVDNSIANAKTLQALKLEKFEPIIIKGNVRYLRPTLFDLLAFRALDYYRNDERYITKPAYAFEISDSVAFADAAGFINHVFTTNDSISLHHRALEVYQQLLAFHINDTKHDALIDGDLDRLNFVRNFSTQPNKDELYRTALGRLINKFNSEPAITEAIYLLANWHYEKGNRYDPIGDTSNRYSIAKAMELCGTAIAMDVKTQGAVNCKNLLTEILHQEIKLKAEEVNTTGEPFRMLVQYRNVSNIFVRVVKYDRATRDKIGQNQWEDQFWKNIVALPVVTTYSYTLPAINDYQSHRAEIKIDALPVGEYGVLISSDKNFALAKNAMALQRVYVSDISYVNNDLRYHVLNRKTGVPLAGAKVQVWEEYYNQSKQREDIRKLESYLTDGIGYFELKKNASDNSNRNILLDISHGSDRLFIDVPFYNYVYDYGQTHKDSIQTQTLLFTDRSIYRPGQTVYFKGILINRDLKGKTNSVVPDHKSQFFLHDANGQAVDSLEMISNEFGSYSGKFIIPNNLLTGEFSLSDKETNSNVTFRVEEYKRPKFEVKIASPKGTYRLNDSISVEGSAVAYAGNNINGAKANYRVTRRAILPYRMGYDVRIWPPYPQQEMEIAHGSVVTGENGKFNIPFVAIPDNTIPRSSHAVFHYTITTDVTDINGETRSGSTNVTVGYEALKMDLNVPSTIHIDSLKHFQVSTTNMNDSFERADVKISMYKLNTPQRIFRKRYWEQPDQFVMTRDDYYKNFPYDQYDEELNKLKWQKQNAVLQDTITTSVGGAYKLNKKITDAGWYVIEAFTKDKFGDSVIAREFVLLYNDRVVSPEAGVVLSADKYSAEPGEKVKYSLITNVDNAQIIRELLRNNETKKDLINAQKNNAGSSITVNENDRGGVVIKTVFVKNNRVYADVLNIAVPSTNKQLKIEYTTYRDKTLPGVGEKWKVKISGMKGDKVAAELLTSMYDGSLDQFYPHQWNFPALWTSSLDNGQWGGDVNFTPATSVDRNVYDGGQEGFVKVYDRLRVDEDRQALRVRGFSSRVYALKAQASEAVALDSSAPSKNEDQQTIDKETFIETKNQLKENPSIQPRKNLNETAFFFPDLKTDANGNVEFSFTSPEALTTWNWMLLAHTKDLAYAYDTKKIITQKQLMVQPNAPRFLREGDSINFSVKVANMSASTINGMATLELSDPSTGKIVTGLITNNKQNFSASAGQSVPISFSIKIPSVYTQLLTWKVIATSVSSDASLSDGEEDIIPVLSNRMLVTETMTLPIRNTSSKTFRFEKLLNSGATKSLKNKAFTVEFTSNPAWYAIQALPYLAEEKHESAEQLFNRFYANALASKLASSFPKLKAVIDQWKSADTSAFLSNLQKNQDLKNILLEETPWVLEAKNESQHKKNIALLFDIARMSNELTGTLNKLISMQSEDGSFVWYKGGPPDRYMTQYIISGIGHLRNLDAIPSNSTGEINNFTRKAINYLDQSIRKDYDQIRKNNKKIAGIYIALEPIQYLYMRSFFTNVPVPANIKPAYNYFHNKVKQEWVKQNTYMRAMIALSFHRTGDAATAKKIIAALKESAIENAGLGTYWKDMTGGYYWYQAPIETQSVLIEAFNEIAKDEQAAADMKTWLLKNKQTNNWKTTKATADACYALLLDGGGWIEDDASVSIQLGDKLVTAEKTEAGSGYFRTTFDGDSIKSAMGNITVNLKTQHSSRPAWGGVYWQYFEDLDKITNAATPLRINKKLFVQKNTDRGPVIEPLDNNSSLHVGDRVKVRIEIRTDRNMEYVHLKDMRSSTMEPVNVLSEYKWQGGLGYYESTKDASTNFFFSYLPKGTYVFEYDLFVTHTGHFSNGVAIIQCMYAPEFGSHSEGIKINVVK